MAAALNLNLERKLPNYSGTIKSEIVLQHTISDLQAFASRLYRTCRRILFLYFFLFESNYRTVYQKRLEKCSKLTNQAKTITVMNEHAVILSLLAHSTFNEWSLRSLALSVLYGFWSILSQVTMDNELKKKQEKLSSWQLTQRIHSCSLIWGELLF